MKPPADDETKRLFQQACAAFAAGHDATARSTCVRLLEHCPDHFGALQMLGVLDCRSGMVEEGLQRLHRSAALEPAHPGPWFNLGNAYLALERLEEAEAAFLRATCLQPGHVRAWYNLGWTRQRRGDLVAAIAAYEKAAALDPNDVNCLNSLTVAYNLTGRSDEALAIAERALALAPNDATTHGNLITLYERANLLKEAADCLQKALPRWPNDPMLQLLAAKMDRREENYGRAQERLEALARRDVPPDIRRGVHFEFGKLQDLRHETEAAYGSFLRAHEVAGELWPPDTLEQNEYARDLDRLLDYFTAEHVHTWPQAEGPTAEASPTFLIGFMRSGTTLLDTILGGHPDFEVLEERPTISDVVDALAASRAGYPAAIGALTDADLQTHRERYFQRVQNITGKTIERRILDKYPLYTAHVGLIYRLFPNARFILAIRHPCDVCLSCFMQELGPNPITSNFVTLERTAIIYAKVMRLWQRYADLFPLNAFTLRYEDLVEDVEGQCRSLLQFLGAGWHDSLLDHQKHAINRGQIGTPSYHQVAQPIYRHARHRWRRYEQYFAPCLDTLQPFIDAFGYGSDKDRDRKADKISSHDETGGK